MKSSTQNDPWPGRAEIRRALRESGRCDWWLFGIYNGYPKSARAAAVICGVAFGQVRLGTKEEIMRLWSR